MRIYTIPGLGFDSRIFRNIHVDDIEIHHLEWKEPLPDQSLTSYAKSYLPEIQGDQIILIGHSFGGILSLEISKLINIEKIFLISSIRHEDEMPLTFNAISKLKLYNLITPNQLAQSVPFWGRFYDYTNGEEMQLAMDMIKRNSKTYLKWAVKTIVNWKSEGLKTQAEIYQIHGKKDKTFPISKISKVDLRIDTGGHFMVFKHGKEISNFIQNHLNQ